MIARVYPRAAVREVPVRTSRGSVRRRLPPAVVMVCYLIAIALFRVVSAAEVLRCLLEGLRWITPELLLGVSGKSSGLRARTQPGAAPFEALQEAGVPPLAVASTPGAWYRSLRLAAFDALTLALPDEQEKRVHLGLPGTARGSAGVPKLRLTVLM